MKFKLTIISLIFLIFLQGCLGSKPNIRSEILNNRTLNIQNIKTVANNSNNIHGFAAKIYNDKEISKNGNITTVNQKYRARGYTELYFDNRIFSLYCLSKGGDMQKWNNYLWRFTGKTMVDRMYICNVDNKIHAAQLTKGTPRFKSAPPGTKDPYLHQITYLDALSFKDYTEHSKSYSSSKGINIEQGKGHNTNSFVIRFDYTNNTNKPILFDFNNPQITVDGTTFEASYKKSYDNVINWTYHTSGNLFEDTNHSKLKLNPGQHYKGFAFISASGLSKSVDSIDAFKTNSHTFNDLKLVENYVYFGKNTSINPKGYLKEIN